MRGYMATRSVTAAPRSLSDPVGRTLKHGSPVGAAVVGIFALELLHTAGREVIDGPYLHFLAFRFKAAGIRPDVSVDDHSPVPWLRAGAGHAADGVVSVFAVVGIDGELSVLAFLVSDLLLANEEIFLRRPAAIDVRGHVSHVAVTGLEEVALRPPFTNEDAQLFSGCGYIRCSCGNGCLREADIDCSCQKYEYSCGHLFALSRASRLPS